MSWKEKMRPLEVFLSLCSIVSGLWFMLFADIDSRWPLYEPMHEVAPGWAWGLVLIVAGVLAPLNQRGVKWTCYGLHLLFWVSVSRFYMSVSLDPPVVALSICVVAGWGYLCLQLALARG